MLTATETARVKKFVSKMDEKTAQAMISLFEITKPGCDRAAYELFDAAHSGKGVSDLVINRYSNYGIVGKDGVIPIPLRTAIKDAVARRFLEMHTSWDYELKPELRL